MKPFREIVTQRIGEVIVASNIGQVTEAEIEAARDLFKSTGQCDHSIVWDQHNWLYDIRTCYICEKGLGTV